MFIYIVLIKISGFDEGGGGGHFVIFCGALLSWAISSVTTLSSRDDKCHIFMSQIDLLGGGGE